MIQSRLLRNLHVFKVGVSCSSGEKFGFRGDLNSQGAAIVTTPKIHSGFIANTDPCWEKKRLAGAATGSVSREFKNYLKKTLPI